MGWFGVGELCSGGRYVLKTVARTDSTIGAIGIDQWIQDYFCMYQTGVTSVGRMVALIAFICLA